MVKNKELFNNFKSNILNLDPVAFGEKYLTLDGEPFRLTNNGYKAFADVYRYIAIKALEPSSKPVIIVKGRQVGATTMASVLEMYFMGCGLFGANGRPPIRIIHAFPQLDLAYAYAKTKLNPMIVNSAPIEQTKRGVRAKSYMQSLLDPTSTSNDSLNLKQFVGGNHMWIESTGDTADRLRGRTADIILYDECQDIPATAIGNASKMLTQAKYGQQNSGVQVFFGTPKQRGSEFFQMWNKSSQQYFHLFCEKCEKLFPLYTAGTDDWEKIWIHGKVVKCPHCQHEQNKVKAAENGKWVATKDPDECDFVGFHLSQLYIPTFDKEKVISEKPENSTINTERVYQNEVLGEFFTGDTSIISAEDIREKCGDMRKMRREIAPGSEQLVVMGIDIGAKADMEQLADSDKVKRQGQSFSCLVVASLKGPNQLNIEYASKFKRNDFASKKEFVDHIMRLYSVNIAVCDIGYTNDFSEIMQNEYNDRFLVSQATSKINEKIKYNKDMFPKSIVFERDFHISEVYEQMKKGNIRFPFGSYEQINWLVQHCTSMEIKPTVSRSGEVSPHYVKGSIPNDGFMALMNAYLAYKYFITKGFTIKNPLLFTNPFDNRAPKQKIPAVLGTVPRMR